MIEGSLLLVLASASPRRRELLALLGVPFDVVAADIDEAAAGASPQALAQRLALEKALTVQARHPARAVLGADTVVALGARILGKPAGAAQARTMLEALRGRVHEVTSGVALVRRDQRLVTSVTTEVRMRDYSDAEIGAYVERQPPAVGPYDGPLDKAGAYAIQDATFAPAAEARGCVCSVIGLPLWTAHGSLRACGLDPQPPPLERCRVCPLAPPQLAA